MHRLFFKIFKGQFGNGKLIISIIGLILGLILVLLALQAYWQISGYLNEQQQLSNHLIINKSVGLDNTIMGSNASFKEEAVQKLKQQDFVDRLGKFQSNQFRVTAYASGEYQFRTQLFFEAVPHSFIDDPPSDFRWEKGDNTIPVLLSRDFLRLYNFGFALSQGLPQLTPGTIGMVPMKIRIEGPGGKKMMKGEVVGFSERIPSILVPKKFMTWANEEIGEKASQNTSRLIMKVNNRENPKLKAYLENHNMQVNSQSLEQSQITGILYSVISGFFIIGMAFIVFALVIVIMNFSLLIAHANQEIRLLVQLGYKHTLILKYFTRYLVGFFLAALLLSLAIIFPIQSYLTTYLVEQGFQLEKGLLFKTVIAGIGFVTIGFFVSLYRIWRALNHVA